MSFMRTKKKIKGGNKPRKTPEGMTTTRWKKLRLQARKEG